MLLKDILGTPGLAAIQNITAYYHHLFLHQISVDDIERINRMGTIKRRH